MMNRCLASAILLGSAALAALADEPVRFIQVIEDESAARLQTAVTRYEKDGTTVDLIGAIHIADKAYFEGLNERFKDYDALLFEMVGGERLGRGAAAEDAVQAPDEDPPAAAGIQQIYSMMSRFLNLSGQTESIDYTAKNFVHADLTHAEFTRLQEERGETLLGFATEASAAGEADDLQPDPAKIMRAVLAGQTNALKLELIHTLGRGGDRLGALEGENVIITDRNQRCMEVLDRELGKGRKTLGIFYGAGHLADFDKRLLERGFARRDQTWLTAWDVPKPRPAAEPEPEAEAAADEKAAA